MSAADSLRSHFLRCCLLLLAVLAMPLSWTAGQAATLPAGFTETRIATALSNPTAMAFAPDGRLFICEQSGRVRVIRNGVLLTQPFLSVSVNSAGERGLLGIAFDPNFASNGHVFVYYTTAAAPIHNRVSRFTADPGNPDVALAGSEVQIFNLPNLSSATIHNGGAIHFGADGRLYIAVGDNSASANAPALTTTLGKVLRINADGSIPADNPFVNQTSGINRAIWARGLRNPFNFAVDRASGRIHVNDVGQDSWEEVNNGVAGANFGWPATEGPQPPGMAGVSYPIHSYQNAGSNCAIVGAAFYSPPVANFPAEFARRYFFGDFCGGFIRTLSPPSYNTSSGFATGISALVDIQVAPDGTLHYLTRGAGEVFRVQFTANSAPAISVHPVSVTVAVGQSATFSVSASGVQPLRYQWQRNGVNIANATAPSFTLPAAALADNGATFRAVVSNNFGSVTSNSATLTVTGNRAPTATITTPVSGTLYRGGQVFSFAGSGSDPEDGSLPPAALTWRVDFHHDDHTHPFVPPTSGVTSGTFTIADRGETSANVFYRVILTARDSAGLTHTRSVDLLPRTATIVLASSPSPLQLTLDGQPVTTPHTFVGVQGIIRTLGAVSPQTSGGASFEFVSWSDGGQATHEIATPSSDTTFTALYQPAAITTVFTDDFETDRGWTLTPGANTATTGLWQRGDPQPTAEGGTNLQLGTCQGPSVNCLITGLAAGASVGANDVDGGVTSLQSPLIALPASGRITLSFRFYFSHLANSSSTDFFRARIVNSAGSPVTVFQELGTATIDAAAWASQSVDLSAFAGQSVRVQFEVADAGTGSLVEGGVDNVVITRQ